MYSRPPPPAEKKGTLSDFLWGEGAGLLTLIANRFDTLTVKQWETDKQWCNEYIIMLLSSVKIGSLSNNDGDGYENDT